MSMRSKYYWKGEQRRQPNSIPLLILLSLYSARLSLRVGRPCTTVSVATAAWLLGQDAAEMAERTS